jgi:release factor glutamine methyltransferase
MTSPSEQTASHADGWTVQRILEWTAGFLKQKGIESPRLESELLLAHARKCPRIRLYTEFTALLTDDERVIMRELVQRRAKREPLAYIVGTREFYGRSFDVEAGVLIPRPETETLIDVCLERIPRDEPREIIEVGFGSGCIAVTIAKQRPQCSVIATDTSSAAMKIASRNVEKHGVTGRVTLLAGDALEPLRNCGRQFDGLVSNPPYIRDDERPGLQPEVGLHEPAEALYAGADGLDVVRKIVSQAPAFMKPGAFLALELDPSQCAAVTTLLIDAGFQSATTRRDLSGNDRIVEATFMAGR